MVKLDFQMTISWWIKGFKTLRYLYPLSPPGGHQTFEISQLQVTEPDNTSFFISMNSISQDAQVERRILIQFDTQRPSRSEWRTKPDTCEARYNVYSHKWNLSILLLASALNVESFSREISARRKQETNVQEIIWIMHFLWELHCRALSVRQIFLPAENFAILGDKSVFIFALQSQVTNYWTSPVSNFIKSSPSAFLAAKKVLQAPVAAPFLVIDSSKGSPSVSYATWHVGHHEADQVWHQQTRKQSVISSQVGPRELTNFESASGLSIDNSSC